MSLKKYQGHQGLLMIQAEKNRGLKKHQAMEKEVPTKSGKKLKRPHSLKKHQIYLNLLIQATKKKEKGRPRTIKGEKMPPSLGVEEEAKRFLDIKKESKNFTIDKKVEKAVFMAGTMKVTNYHMLHYVIPNTLKGC